MDTIILAASLIAFFALLVAWMALPASTPTTVAIKHAAPVSA
jgi:hypothetical protein